MAEETERGGESSRGDPESKRQKSRRLIAGLLSAFVIATVTALATGLVSGFFDLFNGDDPVVSSSAREVVAECGRPLFVPKNRADALLSGATRNKLDWTTFRRSNQAAPAGVSLIEVSIQGESARKVTLTRVRFIAERRPRPAGAVFFNPCGDSTYGRSLIADLDSDPVVVVRSIGDPKGSTVPNAPEQRPYRRIRFPWTVSLTDPLQLNVIAITKRCYCTWRAEIPWQSGGRSGVIRIDNHAKGYGVVGGDGLKEFSSTGGGPSGWGPVPQ